MMADEKSDAALRSRFSGHPAHGDDARRSFEPFTVMRMVLQPPLTEMMQAALVRNVAFNWFANFPLEFEGHPANGSLTWRALDALEGTSIVQLVERLRNKLYEPFVPESVSETLEKLVGHRHRISHPSNTRAEDWRDPKMQRFEAEGRRYESCVPLVWDLHRAINEELAKAPDPKRIPDFHITWEMVHLLRQIFVSSMKEASLPSIPNDQVLLKLLHDFRDVTLQQCQDRANGVALPPRRETPLDRMWAATLRGEDPEKAVADSRPSSNEPT